MRREVVVPQSMVDCLEVPLALAGLHVDGDQRFREEVVAEPVGPVVVVGRRPGRQVHVAQLVVAGEHRPDVGVARVAPRIVQPRVDAELVGAVRHGMEVPGVLAGPDVPGPHPARDRLLGDAPVGDVRAVDHLVADDDRRRVDAVEQRVQVVALAPRGPREADHRVDHAAAVGPEVGARPPGRRVRADDVAVAGAPEDAFVPLAVGPVGDAPLAPCPGHRRRPLFVALGVEDPERLARLRVDGDALRQRRVEVEDSADHQRRGLEAGRTRQVALPVQVGRLLDERLDDGVERRRPLPAAGRRPADPVVDRHPLPDQLEVGEVAGVDLVERRVLLAADVSGVAAPLAVRGVVGLPRAGVLLRVGGRGRPEQCGEQQHDDERE